MFVEFIGALAAITSTISLFPQIIKVYKTRSAEDLSYMMLWNFLVTSILWFVYGLMINGPSIWICNLIMTVTAIILLVLKYKFDRQLCVPKQELNKE